MEVTLDTVQWLAIVILWVLGFVSLVILLVLVALDVMSSETESDMDQS